MKKTWTARVAGTMTAAGLALVVVALPASAGTTATAWGDTLSSGTEAALALCKRLNGVQTSGTVSYEKVGGRYKVTVPCSY